MTENLPMYRIIVAGGREFNDYYLLRDELIDILYYFKQITPSYTSKDVQFVLGGARGADTLGERFADEYGFDKKRFIPNWKKPDGSTDRGAGIKRNHEMGDYATHLVAFWDGKSSGTKDMIEYATKKGLKVKVVRY